MPRYFLEVMYKGTAYSGFQIQANAITVQSVVEDALRIYLRESVNLTGSSRTDAGVHALQNFFHFDYEGAIPPTFLYNLNAILSNDVVVLEIREVPGEAHCRFDALSREYAYYLYDRKDPFREDRAWYYPYSVDLESLNKAAGILKEYEDFTSFSKRNTQVKTFKCRIEESFWESKDDGLVYHVRANRFLRGMVKGLVGTMLLWGRGKIEEEGFRAIIESRDCSKADFTPPAQGLFLVRVNYPI